MLRREEKGGHNIPGPDERSRVIRNRSTLWTRRKPPYVSEISELAHDLKNLILPIQSAAEFLLAGNRVEGQKHYLRSILQHTDRMKLLVEDILTAPERPARCHPVNLTELVSQVAHRVGADCRVGISCLYSRMDPIFVMANELRLWRALYNLVLNAAQAATPSAQVEVRLSPEPAEGMACIEIVDSGPGIPDGDQNHMFEPFFTTKPGGKGFGLTVAKRFIEQVGGRISFSSGMGRGTTFKVLLPLAGSLNNSP